MEDAELDRSTGSIRGEDMLAISVARTSGVRTIRDKGNGFGQTTKLRYGRVVQAGVLVILDTVSMYVDGKSRR